jgi:GntR family transcriptional repressor for pyruvate dehydrogenase complex
LAYYLGNRGRSLIAMERTITTTQFTPVRSLRLSEEIIRQIARLVEDGSLRLNDRFPSERHLQERWQVSRPVLREAFRVLEMQGVVDSRPGAGRYLRSEHIPDPIRLRRMRLLHDRDHLLQVWDAREAVEGKAAELASERAGPEDLAAMRRALQCLDETSSPEPRRFDLNREFHMSIARASGNSIIEEMISALLTRSNEIGFREALDDQEKLDLDGRHEQIYKAIAARNPVAARAAVIRHFDRMRRSIAV